MGEPIAALVFVNVCRVTGPPPGADAPLPGVDWLASPAALGHGAAGAGADIEHLRDVVLVQLHGMPEVRSTETVFLLDERRPVAADPGISR